MIPTTDPNYGSIIQTPDRKFLARLKDGNTIISCDIVKITVSKGSCGSIESFTSGAVISNMMTAEVKNLSSNLKGRDIKVEIGLMVNDNPITYEYIQIGIFTITMVEKTLYSTILTGYGFAVSKTGGAFTSPQDLTPAQTLNISNIVSELATETGLTINVDANIVGSTELTYPMSGLTQYQALQAVAGVVGGYVKDTYNGQIDIKLYDDSPTLTVYARQMRMLPVVEESDYSITGVVCTTPAGNFSSGTVNVATECMWVDSTNFTQHKNNLIGYTYRPAEIDLTLGDPRLEGDDVLTVTDANGSTYVVACHEVVHSYTGGFSTTIRSAVASQIENDIATVAPISSQVADAKEMAQEAYDLASQAGDTSQYFWHTTTDTGAGAGSHITEIPQAEFLQRVGVDPTDGGGNTLINSSGMAIRQGLTQLAKFEQETERSQNVSKLTLGTSNNNIQSHVEVNYQGLKAVDKEGTTFFEVKDSRNVDGYLPITQTFAPSDGIGEYDPDTDTYVGWEYMLSYAPVYSQGITVTKDGVEKPITYIAEQLKGDGSTRDFTLLDEPVSVVQLYVDGDPATYTISGNILSFTTAPADGSAIWIIYKIADGDYTRYDHIFDIVENKWRYAIYFKDVDKPTSSLTVEYETSASSTKAFTYGTRDASDPQTNVSATFGVNLKATGLRAFANGNGCKALGNNSHAEGYYSETRATGAHATGASTVAYNPYQFVCGKSNAIGSADDLAFIIGGGNTSGSSRKNVFTVDFDGDAEALGSITAKGGAVVWNGLTCRDDLSVGGDVVGNVNILGQIDTTGRARFKGTSYVDGNFYANQESGSANCYMGCQQSGTTAIRMTAQSNGHNGVYNVTNSRWLVVDYKDGDLYVGGNSASGINMTPSQTANKVLASPNGSTGIPTWRALVANDIPSLGAEKITSGTFGVARMPEMFQIKSYTYERTTSLSAGAGLNITGTNLGVSTPSNYKPIGVVFFATSTKDVVIRWVRANVTGSNYVMGVTNVSSSAVASFTAYIDILYAYTGTVA